MPDGYVCYDPPAEAPPVGPLPAAAKGYVTFGSFNNLAKITPQVVERLGADPAAGCPQSRLVLKYRGLDDAAGPARCFESCSPPAGSTRSGWSCCGWPPTPDCLADYNRDRHGAWIRFPTPAALTTCEALVDGRAGGHLSRARPLPAGIRSAICRTSG